MRPLIEDLGHAFRALRSSRRTTLLAIVLFAVAIGVTSAIYAVVQVVMLQPGVMRDSGGIVVAWQRDDARATPVVELSYDEVEQWRHSTRTFEALGVFSSVSWPLAIVQGDARARVAYAAVSASFFEVAGTRPAMGRALRASDDDGVEPRVAVIGDTLWRERFGGVREAVGSLMRVQEGIDAPVRTIEIVGVMPAGFELPRSAQLWLPAAPSLRAFARRGAREGDALLRDLRVFYALGRLRDGASVDQAGQELSASARGWRTPSGAVTGAVVTPIDAYLQGAARPVLWTMFGGALLMVLLTCSSVAGLQLFRTALAERALAVHLALGAPRRRLAVRALAEGGLLAVFGVAGALLVGTLVMNWLVATAPLDVPRLSTARFVTGPVLVFMAALTATVGALAGAWPTLFIRRIDAGHTLTAGVRASCIPASGASSGWSWDGRWLLPSCC